MLLIKEKEPDCRLFLSATPETRRKWNNIYRLPIGWDPVTLTFFDKMKGRYGDHATLSITFGKKSSQRPFNQTTNRLFKIEGNEESK